MRRPAAGSDEGFTLVELLIAIILMGVICAVMANAFSVGVSASQVTDKQLQESNDAAFTTTWLTRDIQSSATVAYTQGCGPNKGQPAVLGLSWSQPKTAAPATDYVDYVYSAGTLTRVQCGTVSRTLVVANELSAAPTVTPSTCSSHKCLSMTLTELDGTTFTVKQAERLS